MLKFLDRMAFWHKLAAAAGVILCLILVFYFLLYQRMSNRSESMSKQIQTLKMQYTTLQRKKTEYEKDLQCLEKLKACHDRLKRMLPERGETNQLLKTITEEGRKAGLEFLFFEEQREESKEDADYAEIDIKIQVRGFYFQILDYMEKIQALRRIVSIQTLHVTDAMPKETGISMKAELLARTFRHLTDDEIAAREEARKERQKKKSGKK